MARQIQLDGTTIVLDSEPNECPYCLKTIVPEYATSRFVKEVGSTLKPIYALFYCTNSECKHGFLNIYQFRTNDGHGSHYVLRGLAKVPVRPSITFPESIVALSPQFVKIYEQAHVAEENGLDQVTGLGYRKALEFLVKDFLIKQQPEEEESIKKAMLGNCIKDKITDARIKEMAKRATWLGNDEAHYVRKWVDRDVQDMKVIIKLIVSMVEQEYLFNSYMESMPDAPRA